MAPCFSHGPCWQLPGNPEKSSVAPTFIAQRSGGAGPGPGSQAGRALTRLSGPSFPPPRASWLPASVVAEVVKFFLHKVAYINRLKDKISLLSLPCSVKERFLLTTFPCCSGKVRPWETPLRKSWFGDLWCHVIDNLFNLQSDAPCYFFFYQYTVYKKFSIHGCFL